MLARASKPRHGSGLPIWQKPRDRVEQPEFTALWSDGRACPGHRRLSSRRPAKDVDAREDRVPAASRGEASLRGHDGPYADTKEQLGGYYLINVPDLDTALEWAARIPAAPGSVIEVRPNLVPPG